MKNSLLTENQKKEIVKLIKAENYAKLISILEKIKTPHAGTAKTNDKRYVIREIVRFISERSENYEKHFFNAGNFFCNRNEDVAKEIGVTIIWRGFKYKPGKVKDHLLKIADDANWEVREYAGSAFAGLTSYDVEFYKSLLKWAGHPSENVRRAVVFAALGLRNKETISKAFSIFEILMYDRSKYVRKNLGPFILGSYFGNKFPEETLKYLSKWSKISNENVGWNVIMAFNNSFGNNHPQKAFWILRHFTGEVSPNIKRALKSTLNFLSKRHKQSVDEFKLKYNLNTAGPVKS